MEHPTCVHAVTTKYDKSLKLNRNKYLFMEIVFLSCHVSIKNKSALRGILARPPDGGREKAAPPPYGRATATGGRHQISKTCQPARSARTRSSDAVENIFEHLKFKTQTNG